MSIDAFLNDKAHEYALELEDKSNKLKADLEDVRRRERQIQLKLDAARNAIKRSADFQSRAGTDFQCPSCWIHDKSRTSLTPVPGTSHATILVCGTCKVEFIIPFGPMKLDADISNGD
ncbi:MAG: hypothetical protein ACXV3D_08255 [Halobacteriota archaeon]